MAHITELGPLYAQKLYWHLDKPPLLHLDRTVETGAPYRLGKCVVIRAPFSKAALAIGAWVGKSRHEEEALLTSMGARVTKDNGVTLTEEVW